MSMNPSGPWGSSPSAAGDWTKQTAAGTARPPVVGAHGPGGAPKAELAPAEGVAAQRGTAEVSDPDSDSELKKSFTDFVGQTLFGQMLASMRETVDKPAYFHGGQTEEIFQQQLDRVMVEEITEASAEQIADPMFELFTLRRTG